MSETRNLSVVLSSCFGTFLHSFELLPFVFPDILDFDLATKVSENFIIGRVDDDSEGFYLSPKRL